MIGKVEARLRPLQPTRLIMDAPGLPSDEARVAALIAVNVAQRIGPKLSGVSVRRLVPIWGESFFGIAWVHSYVWFNEMGIRPFTMRKLAGKTIPMWLDDPTGEIRRKNPKAKTRVMSGRTQVLIFRKAAHIGDTKVVERTVRGQRRRVTVPRSYPGAAGRIGFREAPAPWTTPGRVGGRIARPSVGVRWRHPGIQPRLFIHEALSLAAFEMGVPEGRISVGMTKGTI